MEILYKNFDYDVKESSEEELTVEHFISTEKKDRAGDVMHADGMETDGMPVVLYLHGKGIIGSEPVAKPLWIRPGMWKRHKGIEAKTQFYRDETGKRLWGKTVQKYMPNWSVGYRIKKATQFKDGGLDVFRWLLLEYSLVGVSENADANTKDTEYPRLYVKYMPLSIMQKMFADSKMLESGGLYEDRIYTDDLGKTLTELNLHLKDFDPSKAQFFGGTSKESEEPTNKKEPVKGEMEAISGDGQNKNDQHEQEFKELKEKIESLESTVSTFVDAVDGKFKEYSETIKSIQAEKQERRIVLKKKEPEPIEKIPKKFIDTIISEMQKKYVSEFRKVLGRVD